ncbi:hypothetical protein [Natronococcus occultus]|uniref:Uncharacterized protein n=1 Tax=Natronococcus occultus SP4 TaxID=694430 RepID=L0JVI0_9EURY|nr:hypothetical protein [Natronococcus occultus]AGB37042.1 hypothetical protein Natoc_1207 [Natronococcus occultus SP4]
MELDRVLSGDQLTGKQAAIIFFSWLAVVVIAGFTLLLITNGTV